MLNGANSLTCIYCNGSLDEQFYGAGDGRGQKFACYKCYHAKHKEPMNNTEYEEHVANHALPDLDFNYAVIGLCGESGEVAEWHKKYNLRKNRAGNLSKEDLKGELGDALFYLTRATMLSGWTLSEIMAHNKSKLDARVAAKFRQVV